MRIESLDDTIDTENVYNRQLKRVLKDLREGEMLSAVIVGAMVVQLVINIKG